MLIFELQKLYLARAYKKNKELKKAKILLAEVSNAIPEPNYLIEELTDINKAKNIIAINKDPNAPIFEIADYAVIGDVLEIIPKLNENL